MISEAFLFDVDDTLYDQLELFQRAYDEVFPEEYKGKVRLGIITNGPAEHQRNKMQALGITKWNLPENIFISGKIGIAKPDPGIFRVLFRNPLS